MKKGAFFKGFSVLLLLAVVMILGSCEDATGSTTPTYSVPANYTSTLVGDTYYMTDNTSMTYTFGSTALTFYGGGTMGTIIYTFVSDMAESTDGEGQTVFTVDVISSSSSSTSTRVITITSGTTITIGSYSYTLSE